MEVLDGYVAICREKSLKLVFPENKDSFKERFLVTVVAESRDEAIRMIADAGFLVDSIDPVGKHIKDHMKCVPGFMEPLTFTYGRVGRLGGRDAEGRDLYSTDAVDVCLCIFILCISALLFVMMLRFLFL